ncbi:hypothetical protein M231_00670 [Tremella mesenterica]|uniref:Uncharacterized protein n=1 Tax=Tremella mesenterica TaxID=5217 RepID=A0A4Q1BUY4_TREME|nr:hypothetical protein M231_00670 [Tremella mesenterica]
MSDMTYVQSLLPRIRHILSSSDLSTVSAKAVRKELIRQGEDEKKIKASREELDEQIGEIYEQLISPPDDTSSEDIPLNSTSTPTIPLSSQPEPLSRKIKKEEPPSPERKPKIEREPVMASGSRETDEQMAIRLQREFDMAAEGRARPSRSTATPARKKKTIKRKSRVRVGSGDEGEERGKKRRNKNSVFNKEMILSDSLAAFIGEPSLSRPQTVKRIWDYVKENDLQDQGDKRYILCDDRLKSVFHTDRLHMFTMNKLLVPHFRDSDDIIYKTEPRPPSPDVKPKVETSEQKPKIESSQVDESEEEYDSEDAYLYS